MEAPIISWIKKNILFVSVKEKEVKTLSTLEDWKDRAVEGRLKNRGNVYAETPHDTYVIKYCFNCNDFTPKLCFNMNGTINTNMIIDCVKLRLMNKQLNQVINNES